MKFESEGFDEEEIKKMCCKNGSFTCGLLQELKLKGRCNSCKKDMKDELKNILLEDVTEAFVSTPNAQFQGRVEKKIKEIIIKRFSDFKEVK